MGLGPCPPARHTDGTAAPLWGAIGRGLDAGTGRPGGGSAARLVKRGTLCKKAT